LKLASVFQYSIYGKSRVKETECYTSTADHFASGLREMIMKKWGPKAAGKAIGKTFGGSIRVKTVHTTIICDDLTKAEKERADRHARLFEVFEPIADWIRNSSARTTLADRRSSSALSRKEAALRLSGSTLKADIRALIKALHDVEVRGTAVSVLTGIGEKGLPHLRKAYEREKSQDTRDSILQVLEHIKDMSNKRQEKKRFLNSISADPVKDEMNVLHLYNEAASLYNAMRFSEARDLFGRLVRYDPNNTLFAYAMLMCLTELGVPNVAEHLPGELKDRREQLGLVFRQDNLANGLCIRGFSVRVETKEHTANVLAEKGNERFLIQFSDVLGSILSNTYRAASGEQQWERIESGKEKTALERELQPLVVRAHIEIYPLSFGLEAVKETSVDNLVAKLTSPDEADFLQGLSEATSLAQRGKLVGLQALNEAIQQKSGRKNIQFYEPGLVDRDIGEIEHASERILELAKRHALFEDSELSGRLISMCLPILGVEGLGRLCDQVQTVGGTEQFRAFQLLYNQMHSAVQLRHAQG
jgi:hypothetical protein